MATKTFEELKQMAIQIRDEKTNKQNTATRIGTQMLEHLNKLEQEYYDKTTLDKRVTELNISELFPTEGIDGSNEYTLAGAIAKVDSKYRTIQGLKVSFVNESGDTESWEFKGGTWVVGSFSEVGANKIAETDNLIFSSLKDISLGDNKFSSPYTTNPTDLIGEGGNIVEGTGGNNVIQLYKVTAGEKYHLKLSKIEYSAKRTLSYAFYNSTTINSTSFISGEYGDINKDLVIPEGAVVLGISWDKRNTADELYSIYTETIKELRDSIDTKTNIKDFEKVKAFVDTDEYNTYGIDVSSSTNSNSQGYANAVIELWTMYYGSEIFKFNRFEGKDNFSVANKFYFEVSIGDFSNGATVLGVNVYDNVYLIISDYFVMLIDSDKLPAARMQSGVLAAEESCKIHISERPVGCSWLKKNYIQGNDEINKYNKVIRKNLERYNFQLKSTFDLSPNLGYPQTNNDTAYIRTDSINSNYVEGTDQYGEYREYSQTGELFQLSDMCEYAGFIVKFEEYDKDVYKRTNSIKFVQSNGGNRTYRISNLFTTQQKETNDTLTIPVDIELFPLSEKRVFVKIHSRKNLLLVSTTATKVRIYNLSADNIPVDIRYKYINESCLYNKKWQGKSLMYVGDSNLSPGICNTVSLLTGTHTYINGASGRRMAANGVAAEYSETDDGRWLYHILRRKLFQQIIDAGGTVDGIVMMVSYNDIEGIMGEITAETLQAVYDNYPTIWDEGSDAPEDANTDYYKKLNGGELSNGTTVKGYKNMSAQERKEIFTFKPTYLAYCQQFINKFPNAFIFCCTIGNNPVIDTENTEANEFSRTETNSMLQQNPKTREIQDAVQDIARTLGASFINAGDNAAYMFGNMVKNCTTDKIHFKIWIGQRYGYFIGNYINNTYAFTEVDKEV